MSLNDVRSQIDEIDREIVRMLADRERLVREAASFKTDEQAVRAPDRVDQVLRKVRALAAEEGASPEVVEQVYRTMIDAFISLELREHRSPDGS